MTYTNRHEAVLEATQMALNARAMSLDPQAQREAIADVAYEAGIVFTPAERARITVKGMAAWNQLRADAGVTRTARASDYRALA